jgi:alkylated DNA nucleotide flippase Atl1
MTTRERALDDLLAIEVELLRLTAKRNDLRRIVLMQEYSSQRIPQTRIVAGHTKSIRQGSVSEATLKVVREHGGVVTAKEVAALLGDTNPNAVSQTLIRLHARGFLNRERVAHQYGKCFTWSLAVHPDQSVNSKESAMPDDASDSPEPRKDEVRELLGTALDDEKQRFIALAIRAVTDPKFDKYERVKIDCIIQSAAAYARAGHGGQAAFLIPYGNVLTFSRAMSARSAHHHLCSTRRLRQDWSMSTISSRRGWRRAPHQPQPLRFKDRGGWSAPAVAQLTNGATAYEVLELADLDAIEGGVAYQRR